MNAATKSMLELMVGVMSKSEVAEFIEIGYKHQRELGRKEREEKYARRRAERIAWQKRLDVHEATMRQVLKPGDVVKLSYDQERDIHPKTQLAMVVKVNRVNVKLRPVYESNGVYKQWSSYADRTIMYHRPRYVSKIDGAVVANN